MCVCVRVCVCACLVLNWFRLVSLRFRGFLWFGVGLGWSRGVCVGLGGLGLVSTANFHRGALPLWGPLKNRVSTILDLSAG